MQKYISTEQNVEGIDGEQLAGTRPQVEELKSVLSALRSTYCEADIELLDLCACPTSRRRVHVTYRGGREFQIESDAWINAGDASTGIDKRQHITTFWQADAGGLKSACP